VPYGATGGAKCRSKNIVAIGAATTPEEAAALQDAGVDSIAASGFEAAGYRGVLDVIGRGGFRNRRAGHPVERKAPSRNNPLTRKSTTSIQLMRRISDAI